MMAYCEHPKCEDRDDAQECDLYMLRGATPAEDKMRFLCEEHRP